MGRFALCRRAQNRTETRNSVVWVVTKCFELPRSVALASHTPNDAPSEASTVEIAVSRSSPCVGCATVALLPSVSPALSVTVGHCRSLSVTVSRWLSHDQVASIHHLHRGSREATATFPTNETIPLLGYCCRIHEGKPCASHTTPLHSTPLQDTNSCPSTK